VPVSPHKHNHRPRNALRQDVPGAQAVDDAVDDVVNAKEFGFQLCGNVDQTLLALGHLGVQRGVGCHIHIVVYVNHARRSNANYLAASLLPRSSRQRPAHFDLYAVEHLALGVQQLYAVSPWLRQPISLMAPTDGLRR